MRYARLIDEHTVADAPRVLTGRNYRISNPTAATLLAHGYKPLQLDDPSGECPEGWHWEPRYVELDDKIVRTWQAVQDPDTLEETDDEPIVGDTDDPTLADGGEGSPASSELGDAPTEGGE